MSELSRRTALAGATAVAAGAALPAASEAAVRDRYAVGPSVLTPEKRKEFGKRLKDARMAGNWGDDDWREGMLFDLKVSDEEYSAWENGDREPSAFHGVQLAAKFGVPLEWLLGESFINDDEAERYSDIGEQLRQAREKAGLSVPDVALALHVPVAYWQECEKSQRMIDFAIGVRACILLRVDPATIVRPEHGRPHKLHA
jgi:transcriptional regulator with XRE-family HTH domain